MKIFISGLPLRVEEGELTEVFGDFGPVKSLRIIKDHQTKQSKGFGFVEMVNEDEAKEAIKRMNGQRYYENIIRVNVAEDRGPRTDNGGKRKF
jgi:cold-inducible RNA-binding protein